MKTFLKTVNAKSPNAEVLNAEISNAEISNAEMSNAEILAFDIQYLGVDDLDSTPVDHDLTVLTAAWASSVYGGADRYSRTAITKPILPKTPPPAEPALLSAVTAVSSSPHAERKASTPVAPPYLPPSAGRLPETNGWSESIQSVLEQPPANLPRYLILLGVAFTGIFGVWAWTGHIQEVAKGTGKLIPQGETFKVQLPETGEIERIFVREGEQVEKNQLLVELDAAVLATEVARLEQTMRAAAQDLAEVQLLMEQTRRERLTQRQSAIAQIEARLANRAQTLANAETSQALLTSFGGELAAQTERLNRISALEAKGAISKEYVFGIEQEVRSKQQSITRTEGDIAQAQAQIAQIEAELNQEKAAAQQAELALEQSLQRLSMEALTHQATLEDTRHLLAQAQTRLAQSKVRSPVKGMISALEIDNAGEVVPAGGTIAEVVPENTPLRLAVLVPQNKAGLIETNMTTKVKLDAFPFQEYGVLTGKVVNISPDAKGSQDIGSGYQVEIELEKDYVLHQEKPVKLQLGQTGTAEIVVRRRRIIDLILDPIRRLSADDLSL